MKLFTAKFHERAMATSNGKHFTVIYNRKMLTAVTRDQSVQLKWPDVVTGILARFSTGLTHLFYYIRNLLMTGPLRNSEFCFPRISMFPFDIETLRRETNFTVPEGTSHYKC